MGFNGQIQFNFYESYTLFAVLNCTRVPNSIITSEYILQNNGFNGLNLRLGL